MADVFKLLRQLADGGTTILVVEQNVKRALKLTGEAMALESGRLVLHRPADELLNDPHIERLFLGGAPRPRLMLRLMLRRALPLLQHQDPAGHSRRSRGSAEPAAELGR